jgi:DNA polymerase-4
MAADVSGGCEAKQRSGRTATIKIKFADLQQILHARSIAGAIRSRETLHGLANSVLPPEKPIRLVGVTMSNSEDAAIEAGEAVLPRLT